MSVVGHLRSTAAGVACGALLVLLAGPAPALAGSPWWHVSSEVRPTYLHSGVAKDDVIEVTVSATKGNFAIVEPAGLLREELLYAILPYNATALQVQEGLEGLYPSRKVTVTGGSGEPYVITFPGQSLQKPFVSGQFPSFVEQEPLSGGAAEATATQLSSGESDGTIEVSAANLGDGTAAGEAVPVSIADKLPAGVEAVSVEGISGEGGGEGLGPVTCALRTLTCTFAHKVPPYEQIEVMVGVVVHAGAASGAIDEASVSGGGASAVSVQRPVTIDAAPTPFGVQNYDLQLENEGGKQDTQAGSHPFQFTTSLDLNQIAYPYLQDEQLAFPAAFAKDLRFKLPPGLIGNPIPLPRCTLEQFLTYVENINACPAQTAIGVARVTVQLVFPTEKLTIPVPVFNLEPSYGEPARFGFEVESVPVFVDTSIRTGEDYGVTATVSNITQFTGFIKSEVTFWGVPGDPRHDAQRGWGCLEEFTKGLKPLVPCHFQESQRPPAFLISPTSCTGPLQSSVVVDSWAEPQRELAFGLSEPMPALDGCNQLPFGPSLTVTPDGTAGSTPTGLTVDEHVSQESTLVGSGLAEANVKGLSVTLPQGVALNPAAADGLQACSMAQIGLQSAAAAVCPEASKIATVKVKTPLLAEPIEGAAYLAAQNQNPFGSLVAMYIYAESPKVGVRVKATGEVVENQATGQLTAHFERDGLFGEDPSAYQFLPQVPFEDVELHFFGGDRAPLSTPALCGSYTTTGTFTPWSAQPETEAVSVASASSTFDVTSGPNGSPCHDPLPFAPSLTAGTTSIQAGGFSPFTMTMSREDGQQSLRSVQLKMPPGMSGTLSTVKLCDEADANAGTCGPESLIGETTVSVGLGGDPFSVKGGRVYVTGPYRGAPFGLSIVNPAKAGPFDLGQVVVRAKIDVDPETAVLTITTDQEGPYKIPTLLDGIPLQIKHVNVNVNRPGFTFNATNCSPLAITGSLTSTEGATSSLSVPYQATNCAVLAFKPKLEASTSGQTSRAGGASLTVKLGYPAGPFDANIAKVKVELPKALPSRLTTLQKACVAAVFEANPANCPPQSIVGHATATTPVLPVPLTGPAYFVSHGGEAFPSLIIVLQGYGVTVHLVGATFIDQKTGITSSTFRTVPDVPVGTFELNLPEGQFSALAANGNLCKQNLQMPTEFVGQNGTLIKTTTRIATTGCRLSIGVVRHAVHGRKATIAVSVPSAGTLHASGPGLSRGSAKAAGAGTVTVSLSLTGREQRFLSHHPGRRLKVNVALHFTPTHGARLASHVTLLMR